MVHRPREILLEKEEVTILRDLNGINQKVRAPACIRQAGATDHLRQKDFSIHTNQEFFPVPICFLRDLIEAS